MLIAMALAAASVAGAPQPEMALRCAVAENAPLLVRNASTLGAPLSGGPAPVPVSKPLPQMMVEGWKVERIPIAEALGQLGHDGGFSVKAEAGLSPVSWKGDAAPLSTVVSRLAQEAGGVATFDGSTITISRPVAPSPWRLQRPAGRDATLAILDALRGYGATEVSLGAEAVTFEATPSVVARIRKGLTASTGVLAFDVWTYRVAPRSAVDWKALDEIAPVLERHPVGAGGQFVTGYVPAADVSKFLARFGDVSALGSQTVAGPQGWAMDVPLSQCSETDPKAGSAMMKPNWTGQTMSVSLSGSPLGTGLIQAIAPGSSAILAGPSNGGSMVVAVVRPRVLLPR